VPDRSERASRPSGVRSLMVTLDYPTSPSGHLVHFLDVVLVVWTAAWIVLGLVVGHEVRGLTKLSDTVEAAGTTLDRAGRQLDTLKGLPFVGNRIQEVGNELSIAANSAAESGRTSREHIRSLSVLLALAIAAAPTLPLIALYVPLRRSRIKEVRAVRRSLRQAGGDPVFEEFLARRAAERLPYHVLRTVSSHPWEDLQSGHYRALADAELLRLGIRRRKSEGRDPSSVPSRA
jgi:hypothetical protein